MAEQTPPVQNKGMLVVAVVLGVAAVLVYNAQISAVRSEAIGAQAKIVRFDRDMRKGEKIDPTKDVSIVEISKKLAEGLIDVAIVSGPEELKRIVEGGGKLNRDVLKGNFFSTSMIIAQDPGDQGSQMHEPGNVLRRIPLRGGVTKTLKPGGRVNLIALIPSSKEGQSRAERIIEDVWVIAVGGSVAPSEPGAGGDEGLSSYRDIVIEVTPQASLELEEVLSYVGSGVDVEVLNPIQPRVLPPKGTAGLVKPGLLQGLRGGAAPPVPRTGGGGSGTGALP